MLFGVFIWLLAAWVVAFGNNAASAAHKGGAGRIAVAFYLFILATRMFLRIASPDQGRDLNPVLQDIGLAVSAMLYLGCRVLISFPCGLLIEGRIDAAWAARCAVDAGGVDIPHARHRDGSYWAWFGSLGWGGGVLDPVEVRPALARRHRMLIPRSY
jgi:cytochrome c biogenesis factor